MSLDFSTLKKLFLRSAPHNNNTPKPIGDSESPRNKLNGSEIREVPALHINLTSTEKFKRFQIMSGCHLSVWHQF